MEKQMGMRSQTGASIRGSVTAFSASSAKRKIAESAENYVWKFAKEQNEEMQLFRFMHRFQNLSKRNRICTNYWLWSIAK
jgi:hypothetical protein